MRVEIQRPTRERVSVAVPDDAQEIFNWLVKYSDEFRDKPTAVLSYLISLGAKSAYAAGLENIVPLDEEVLSQLAEESTASLKRAAE